jgi:universal stress protein A
MWDYRRILVVLDLKDDSLTVGRRAKAIAERTQAEIVLLHVVEYIPMEPMGETLLPSVQVERELVQRAEANLAQLAQSLVLGSRERHGLAILLNFTEDTVLHAAPCDVLAVRLQ